MKKIILIINLIVLLTSIKSFGQLTNGLKAHYTFGGNANDVSGQNNNGNLIGTPTLTADRFGTPNCAYEFPGNSTNFIDINYSSDFNILATESFSISLWFQGGSPAGGDLEILFQKNNPANIYNLQYDLALYDGNKPVFGAQNNGVWSNTTTYPNVDPNWHNLIAIYDNRRWYIYEDNILKDSDLSQNYGISPSIGNIIIGKNFMGKIDDIRFYNRLLTVSEIGDIYNLPGSCQSLDIQEISTKDKFVIYPNPTKNLLHISNKNDNENNLIIIYDVTGREVMKIENSTEETIIDISTLKEGTYLVKYINDEKIQTKLILKQN